MMRLEAQATEPSVVPVKTQTNADSKNKIYGE